MVSRAEALDALLAGAADRTAIALRLEAPAFERLLRSVVETTVALFDAAAASIALVEPDGRLRFRVAAGAQGEGIVGVTVEPGEGIAGFVQATGQPLAISNVAADPRFDRDSAARTGYVPTSLMAVPLESNGVVVGVLEVLDKRGGAFDLRDIALAGAFAQQAAVAIDVSRVDRDAVRIIVSAVRGLAGEENPRDAEAAAVAALSDAATDVSRPEFWSLVERLAALLDADPARLALVTELVDVAVRHLAPAGPARHRSAARHSWRRRTEDAGE